MTGRVPRGWGWLVLAGLGLGCGGSRATKEVKFVGFDASQPLVRALRNGTLQGIVVQNPLKMGQLAVKTMVDHLEGKEVPRTISTGETIVTPENMGQPEIAVLIDPPKVSSGTVGGGEGRKKWRVAVIPKGTTHEFWQTIKAGAFRAAEELGNVEVDWQAPLKEDDRALQIQLVQTAVANKVDGIVLAPLDATALAKPVEEAVAAGIPVVVFDSALKSDKPVSYVATDNYHGGVLAAERLGEILEGQGRVILVRYQVGSASTEEREQGFLDTLKAKFPKVALLSDSEYAGATSDSAQKTAQNLVARYKGEVDGIFTPNESSTAGMLRALADAGMLKRRP